MTYDELKKLDPGTIIKGLRVFYCDAAAGSSSTLNVDGWIWDEKPMDVIRTPWYPSYCLNTSSFPCVVDLTESEPHKTVNIKRERENYKSWLFRDLTFEFKPFFPTFPFIGMYTGKYIPMLSTRNNTQVLVNILADTQEGWLHMLLPEKRHELILF